MTTANVSISSSWTKVADAADASLLISWLEPIAIEFAATDTDAAPSVPGHMMLREQGLTRAMIGAGFVWARTKPGSAYPTFTLTISKSTGGVPVSLSTGNVTITGPITASNEVEITNETGNPIPVSAAPRLCVGRQTLSVTAGAVATLTVPAGAVAAMIQADGGAVSVTLDGTAPTSSIGSRIDDGTFYYVDTALASVKLISRGATTNVQVVYFNKA